MAGDVGGKGKCVAGGMDGLPGSGIAALDSREVLFALCSRGLNGVLEVSGHRVGHVHAARLSSRPEARSTVVQVQQVQRLVAAIACQLLIKGW